MCTLGLEAVKAVRIKELILLIRLEGCVAREGHWVSVSHQVVLVTPGDSACHFCAESLLSALLSSHLLCDLVFAWMSTELKLSIQR